MLLFDAGQKSLVLDVFILINIKMTSYDAFIVRFMVKITYGNDSVNSLFMYYHDQSRNIITILSVLNDADCQLKVAPLLSE